MFKTYIETEDGRWHELKMRKLTEESYRQAVKDHAEKYGIEEHKYMMPDWLTIRVA
jgi:hypothetical protein